jgi:ribonuclease Z
MIGSLGEGYSWKHGDLEFRGYSLAGITTSLFFKNAQLCFDLGQGMPFQMGARRVLLTHGHLDHAAGVPYFIAQRNMQGQDHNEIYGPAKLVEPLSKIIQLWSEIDQHEYRYQLRAAEQGKIYEIDKLYSFRPFPTVHRVPSQGYLVYQKRKRLKEEYRGEGEALILAARRNGIDPNETYLEPIVAFTGDTQIDFLDLDEEVKRAKILFVECTFWDEAKPVEHARKWGHLHIDELIQRLPELTSEKIMLIHASVRYSTAYLDAILDKRLGPADRARVQIFPRGGK